jgi:hypothetical protein
MMENELGYEQLVTSGTWATEAESVAALDIALNQFSHLWHVYPEVCGAPQYLRPEQERKGVRIDRILFPRRPLLDMGWTAGAIGIECKRSGIKGGPALSQCLDYLRAGWTLTQVGGVNVTLGFCFLWPLSKVPGTVASIMAQQRIGAAFSTQWDALRLVSGESNIITVRGDGDVRIGACNAGTRLGSR